MTGDVKGPQKPQAAAQAPRAAEPSYWDAVAAWYLTTLPNDAARAEARDAPLLWTRDAEQTAEGCRQPWILCYGKLGATWFQTIGAA